MSNKGALTPDEERELAALQQRIDALETQLTELSETIDPRSDELIMLTEVYDGLVLKCMELMARKR